MEDQNTQKYYKVVHRTSDGRLVSSNQNLPKELIATYCKGVKTRAPAGKLLVFCNLWTAKAFIGLSNFNQEIWEVEVGLVMPVKRLVREQAFELLIRQTLGEIIEAVDNYFSGLFLPSYYTFTPPIGTVGTDWVILKRKV